MMRSKGPVAATRTLVNTVKLVGWAVIWVALGLIIAVLGTYLIPVPA